MLLAGHMQKSVTGAIKSGWTDMLSVPQHATCPELIDAGEHRAEGDVWLSPESRLLADVSSSPEDLVYDGCGHRIVLPQDVAMDDPLPLLLVGVGKTLILRNVRIVHASSLPACLQLAPGEQPRSCSMSLQLPCTCNCSRHRNQSSQSSSLLQLLIWHICPSRSAAWFCFAFVMRAASALPCVGFSPRGSQLHKSVAQLECRGTCLDSAIMLLHGSAGLTLQCLCTGAQLIARSEDHVDMLQAADPDIEGRADRAHFYAHNTSRYRRAACCAGALCQA